MGLDSIVKGKTDCLYLGNLNAKRDWGHAKDYVNAMWLMLQQETPEDFVIATGEQYSVKDFVDACCYHFGISIFWTGEGLGEIGVDLNTGDVIVRVDPKYFRPAEVETLLGDSSKAVEKLGWRLDYSFQDLVEEMCSAVIGK